MTLVATLQVCLTKLSIKEIIMAKELPACPVETTLGLISNK